MEMAMKEERKEEEQRDSLHCSQCKRDVTGIVQFAFVCLDCSSKYIFSYGGADGTKKIINRERVDSRIICRKCKQELHECHKTVLLNQVYIADSKVEIGETMKSLHRNLELLKIKDDDRLH